MKEYVITLINGTTLMIKAETVEYSDKNNYIRFFADRKVVARFNMNNVAGWIDYYYFKDKHTSRKEQE